MIRAAPPDLVALERAIDARCPELAPIGALRPLSTEGWSSLALESASGLVVLAARGARPEWRPVPGLLAAIAGSLPAAVPSPATLLNASGDLEHVGHAVLLYPRLAGRALALADAGADDVERVARDLGRFLAALHAVPLEAIRRTGIPEPEPAGRWLHDKLEVAMPVLRERLTAAETARIEAWRDAFSNDERMREYTPALRHGDLWAGNVLVEETSGGLGLSGVIDWEDAAIGDPALDFADHLYLGRPFLDAVVEAYRAAGGRYGAAEEHRMRRWWESREFPGVAWSIRQDDAAELDESIAKLRANPVLAGWDW